jgi:hypothetical protein
MGTPVGVKQRETVGDLTEYGVTGSWLLGKSTRPRKARMRSIRKRMGEVKQRVIAEIGDTPPEDLTDEQIDAEDELDRLSDRLLCDLVEASLEDADGNAATGVADQLEASLEAGTIDTNDLLALVARVQGEEAEGEGSPRSSN